MLVCFFPCAGLPQSLPAVVTAGTTISARLETTVATATSEVGDGVQAVIAKDIRDAKGEVSVPRGSRLKGRVETLQAGTPGSNDAHVRLVFREVELPDGRQIPTWITNSFAVRAPRRTVRYVIAVSAGGIAGALIGGKSARVAGLLGGLLAGFVIANNSGTGVQDVTLKSGQEIQLQLGEDLVIP